MKPKYVVAFYSGLQLCLTSWDIYFDTILSPHVERCWLVPRYFGQASSGAKHECWRYLGYSGPGQMLVTGEKV